MNLKTLSVFSGLLLTLQSPSFALGKFEFETWRGILGKNDSRQQLQAIINRDKANQEIFSDINKRPVISDGLYYGLRSYNQMNKEEIKGLLYSPFISVGIGVPYMNQKPLDVFYKRAKIILSGFGGGFSELDRIREAIKKPVIFFETNESINQAFMDWKTN